MPYLNGCRQPLASIIYRRWRVKDRWNLQFNANFGWPIREILLSIRIILLMIRHFLPGDDRRNFI